MKKLVKLRLNQFSHIDYFNYVFTTFLALESGNYVAGYYGGVRKLLDFIKNKILHLSFGFGATLMTLMTRASY